MSYAPGENIAMKVPPHLHAQTVAFYRDTLKLPVIEHDDTSTSFQFGTMRLWIDRVPTATHAEIWLEIRTDNLAVADRELSQAGAIRCDQIEPLPTGFDGFWTAAPSGIVHLVSKR